MRRRISLVVAPAALTVAATAAHAGVPKGNGLEHVVGKLVCGSDTTFDVLVTRGNGATGWRVDQGQHHVLSFFSITYHLDSGDVTDAKSWARRRESRHSSALPRTTRAFRSSGCRPSQSRQ
jgi:hypothetical protein